MYPFHYHDQPHWLILKVSPYSTCRMNMNIRQVTHIARSPPSTTVHRGSIFGVLSPPYLSNREIKNSHTPILRPSAEKHMNSNYERLSQVNTSVSTSLIPTPQLHESSPAFWHQTSEYLPRKPSDGNLNNSRVAFCELVSLRASMLAWSPTSHIKV